MNELTIKDFENAAALLKASVPKMERKLYVTDHFFYIGLEAARKEEAGFTIINDKPYFLGAELIKNQ